MGIILASDIFNSRCLANAIMTPITVVSIPVYVIFFIALIKYRNAELSGSFFTLNISIAIADLLALIFSKGFYKFPVFCGLLPFGYDFGMRYSCVIGKITMFFFWYSLHVQMFGVLAITINRFTAVVLPLRHNKIWTDRFMLLTTAGMWIFPLAFGIPVLTTDVCLKAILNSDGQLRFYEYDYGNENIEVAIYAASALWIGIILNITLFILYLIQFFKFVSTRSAVASSNLAAKAKTNTEFKLALCGFIFFVVMSAYGLIFVRMVIEDLIQYYCQICIGLYSVLGDVFSWMNPYVLLSISAQTRKCFLNVIGIGRCAGKSHVSAFINTNSVATVGEFGHPRSSNLRGAMSSKQ